jgi:Leucine-rich repeat (LRR) protein
MKLAICTLVVLFSVTQSIHAQDINFIDDNFKTALLEEGVDTNNDGEIQMTEAAVITHLDLSEQHIFDLTEIAYFTELVWLSCKYNQIESLDLTNNTKLIELYCEHNQLTNLDISNNINLTILFCHENQCEHIDVTNSASLTVLHCNNNLLTDLDVINNTDLTELNFIDNQIPTIDLTNNTNLITLFCNDNELESLDLTNNTNLSNLYCQSNELTYLDLRNGNNMLMESFEAFNNPDLTCILVDNAAMSTQMWSDHIDEYAAFVNATSECPELSSIENSTASNGKEETTIYPNPTTGVLNFTFGESQSHNIRIINTLGQLINTYTTNNAFFQIELGNMVATGMYYVQILDTNNRILQTQKVILK